MFSRPKFNFQLINVYVPSKHSKHKTFISNLWHLAFYNVDTVMTGDFNCIPDSRLDKWGGDDTVADKGIMQLHAFVGPLSLKDVFCMKIMS